MRWDDVGDLSCSIARTLAVVGDRWTMLIVRELFLGTRRFDRFQSFTGMSTGLLTDRLGRLADEGIVRRVRYQDRPARYEYKLTRKGVALYPVLIALKSWGDEHTGRRRQPPTKLEHAGCGQAMSPEIHMTCSACGEEVEARDVRVTKRPAPVAPVAAEAKNRRRA